MIRCRAYKLLGELELVGPSAHAENCAACAAALRARAEFGTKLHSDAGRAAEVSDRFVSGVRRGTRPGVEMSPSSRPWTLTLGVPAVAAVVVVSFLMFRIATPPASPVASKVNTSAERDASLRRSVNELASSIADVSDAIPWEEAEGYMELSSAIMDRRLPEFGGEKAAGPIAPGTFAWGRSPVYRVTDPMGVTDGRRWQNLGRRFGVDVSVSEGSARKRAG